MCTEHFSARHAFASTGRTEILVRVSSSTWIGIPPQLASNIAGRFVIPHSVHFHKVTSAQVHAFLLCGPSIAPALCVQYHFLRPRPHLQVEDLVLLPDLARHLLRKLDEFEVCCHNFTMKLGLYPGKQNLNRFHVWAPRRISCSLLFTSCP